MAESLATAVANSFLDALGNATNYTAPANTYMKLHVGAPGSAGTTNPATETTRKLISFAAATAGTMTTDAALTWTSVAGSEDYTHFTVWDNVSAGTFLYSGTITANAVTAGDTFTIATGDLDLSFTVAS